LANPINGGGRIRRRRGTCHSKKRVKLCGNPRGKIKARKERTPLEQSFDKSLGEERE